MRSGGAPRRVGSALVAIGASVNDAPEPQWNCAAKRKSNQAADDKLWGKIFGQTTPVRAKWLQMRPNAEDHDRRTGSRSNGPRPGQGEPCPLHRRR